MRLTLRTLRVFSSWLLGHGAAHACTVCRSANGHALRAGLFGGNFPHTLLLVAAPLPVLLGAVLLLHAVMPNFAPDLPPDIQPDVAPSATQPVGGDRFTPEHAR